MIEKLLNEFAALNGVEAIALGGSRASGTYDEKSDYDVYLYVTEHIEENVRKSILKKYCKYTEIGNHFWEYEDNCILNDGVDIDILYRNLDDFCNDVARVAERFVPSNSYTTCMWHNLLNCKIIYDKNGRLALAQKRFNVPYPQQLKAAIIKRQSELLDASLPAFKTQIKKAAARKDSVSVNHRVAEFLASYFDLLFAINEKTHPGEKRLVSLCKRTCAILPQNFEENLNSLFGCMFGQDENRIYQCVNDIIDEVKKITPLSEWN